MNYKKRTLITLCTAVLAAVLPAFLLVIYVDPFRIYHPPWMADTNLQENQRYQNAGLINTYLADPEEGYDSVITGTSMSQNFTGAMVAQTLGWKKTLRLLMPGAVAEEQIAVLRHALNTGRVQHVLLEIHPFLYQDSYRQKKQIIEEPSLYFPAYLYNDTRRDDTPYIFNFDVLKMAWFALGDQTPAKTLTPDIVGYWGDDENVASDHVVLNSLENIEKIKHETAGFWVTAKNENEIRALEYPILKQVLFPLLETYCNTNVEIVLFVPPWPRFRYQKSEKVTLRSVYMMRHILEHTAHCQNIGLYNFDLLNLAGDLNNYKDHQHYLPAINREILSLMARKQNRLAIADVAAFENEFINKLNHYTVYTSYTGTGKVK